MTENTKNMLLAAALSLIFIGLWDYFYAFPEMERQKQAQTNQQRMAKVPKLGAPDKTAPAAAKPVARTREAALALSPRVPLDSRSISGSIALKGGRIDDVSLKNYRQTVDPTSPIIVLLSPEEGPEPYYAELGYLTG
jgi:YidC/Oxa1 family membrane protein insertase